jgi:DNA-directed RNA polymerase specialized sigma24 family protein
MVASSTEPNVLTSSHILEIQEQERALLQRALAGENARDEIVLYLQPRVKAMASRMYERWTGSSRRGNVVEHDDLVNSANVAMLDNYRMALTKEKPFGYLFKTAKIAMFHILSGRSDALINTRKPHERITVLSLDIPMEDGLMLTDTLDCELQLPASSTESQRLQDLLHAIETLTERQRMVIQRSFGFNEHAPESLNQISKLFSNNPRTRSAHHHYHSAIGALRQMPALAIAQNQHASHCTGGAK